jgi:hypothetical protein
MAETPSDSAADPLREHRIALSAVQAARQVIDPVFLNTPCYECGPLSTALGCQLILKLETANPIRSFKGRGASLLVRRLDRNSAPITALVSASAGNWGQALAYACRDAGIPLILYAATSANSLKVARMRSLGAEVRLAGGDFDAAKLEAEGFAREAGLRMVAMAWMWRLASGQLPSASSLPRAAITMPSLSLGQRCPPDWYRALDQGCRAGDGSSRRLCRPAPMRWRLLGARGIWLPAIAQKPSPTGSPSGAHP